MNRIWNLDLRIVIVGSTLFIAALMFALGRMPGGIGGTGIAVQPGGIGGTGILGRIDKFGSIWVNGVEIHFPDDMIIAQRDGDSTTDNLALGQVVAVVAVETSGHTQARSIRIIEEVVGPLQETRNSDGQVELTVLGQSVRLRHDTVMALPMEDLQENDTIVIVSGFRGGQGVIYATRLALADDVSTYHVRGQVSNIDDSGFSIGALRVNAKDDTLREGNIVVVGGHLTEGRFIASAVEAQATLPFPETIENISIQGIYITGEDGKSQINGVAFQGSAEVEGDGRGSIAIVTGSLDNPQDKPEIIASTIRIIAQDETSRNDPLPSENVEEEAKETEDDAKEAIRLLEDAEEAQAREIDEASHDAEDAARAAAKEAEDTAEAEVKAAEDAARDAEDAVKETTKDAEDIAEAEAKEVEDVVHEAEDAIEKEVKEAEDAARDEVKAAEDFAEDEARIAAEEAAAQEAEAEAAHDAERAARDAAEDETGLAAEEEARLAAEEEAAHDAEQAARDAAEDEARLAAEEEARLAAEEEARLAAEEEAATASDG